MALWMARPNSLKWFHCRLSLIDDQNRFRTMIGKQLMTELWSRHFHSLELLTAIEQLTNFRWLCIALISSHTDWLNQPITKRFKWFSRRTEGCHTFFLFLWIMLCAVLVVLWSPKYESQYLINLYRAFLSFDIDWVFEERSHVQLRDVWPFHINHFWL